MADEIVKEAREALETSEEYDRDNREQAAEDLRFIAGFQWSDAAKADRAGRPMITINRSGQFLRQVSNPIRQNMPVIKVEPDGDDSDDMAEIANGLLRRIQYNSSAGHVYAAAVEHMVGCGIGWMRVIHDYMDDEGFEQEILVKRVFDPLSVYPDPSSREPARNDMQWCVVSELMPRKAFKAKYPKASMTDLDGASGSTGRNAALTWNSGDYVRVAEYWKRKEVTKTVALFADGQTHEITQEGQKQLRDLKAAGLVLQVRKVKTYTVEMVKVSGAEQLEDTYECPSRFIPLIPVVGAEIPLEDSTYRHGLIRFQREPQQLHNYFLSVAAETLGQQPKAPFLVTTKQIANYKGLWDRANRNPMPYLPYDPDSSAPGAPQRVAPPPLPAGLVQMAQMMADDMKAATGIYDAALGAKSNETSGVAIAQRTEQGNQATFHFVDNLEHSLEHMGRVILDMIPKVYDTERTMKLRMEDDRERPVTVNKPIIKFGDTELKHNDISKMKFKTVRVVLGPSYASRRAEAVQNLVQLAQSIPQIAAVGADLIVKNMDFDGSEELAERLRPPEQNGEAPPDPMAQMQMEHAAGMMQAERSKAEAQAAGEAAKAQQQQQTIEVDGRQALAQLEGTYLDNALKAKKLREPSPQRTPQNAQAGRNARVD